MYDIGKKFSSGDILRYMAYRDIRHPGYSLRAWRELVVETIPRATVKVPPGDYDFHGRYGIPFSSGEIEDMDGKPTDETRYDRYYRRRLPWTKWNRKKVQMLAKRGWNARVVEK